MPTQCFNTGKILSKKGRNCELIKTLLAVNYIAADQRDIIIPYL